MSIDRNPEALADFLDSAVQHSEIIIALTSALVAALALLVSWRADRRSIAAARISVFLDLRERFLEVHEGLNKRYSDPEWRAETAEDRVAIVRYWHHCFDEWFATKKLGVRYLTSLWEDFYRSAMLLGLSHNSLRDIAANYFFDSEKANSKLWCEFRAELDAIWRESHPTGPSDCPGIACRIRHEAG